MKDKIEITKDEFIKKMAEATIVLERKLSEGDKDADVQTSLALIMGCGMMTAEAAKILFEDDEDASKSLAD